MESRDHSFFDKLGVAHEVPAEGVRCCIAADADTGEQVKAETPGKEMDLRGARPANEDHARPPDIPRLTPAGIGPTEDAYRDDVKDI